MQAKSEQFQSFSKPSSIKLNPYTKLPKLYSSTSPTTNDSFPTQPSQPHRLPLPLPQRFKTQLSSKQQQSASFRVISRFIYNHLQKKINFNAQIINNYPNLAIDIPHKKFIIKHNNQLPNNNSHQYDPNYYSYEKYSPNRQSNHTLLLKFKNKHNKNKIINRSIAKDQTKGVIPRKSDKVRYANIDSYFDLSCLQRKGGV